MKHVLALCFALGAAPLTAHPHIFVNTGLVFVVDGENRLTHVQVTWEYDELYSLLVTEDMGIDADYDGVLTAADTAALTGFDMNWIAGFNGDLVGSQGSVALDLSRPSAPTATLTDGKITTTHLRAIKGAPQVTGPMVFKPFDTTYYTAYETRLPVRVQGGYGCVLDVNAPDIKGALAMTQAEIAALPEDYDMEAAGFGDIGERFATKVTLTCAGQ